MDSRLPLALGGRPAGKINRASIALCAVFAMEFGAIGAASAQVTTTYTYDSLGRLQTATSSQAYSSYSYDAAGNRTAKTETPSPLANPVTATVIENSANNPISLSIAGLAATSVAVSTGASHGTATASGTSISYTPAGGYIGSDSFQYTASNANGTSSPATVSITVNPQTPVANNVNTSVAYDSSSDPVPLSLGGGPATSVAVTTQASHGAATASGTSITYTPASGYVGSDSFQYTATNSTGTSSPATVSITVNPQKPVANNVSMTIGTNASAKSVPISLSGGAATSVAVSAQAAHGTATASGTSITYTPFSGYFGSDTFQYTATNAGGTSSPATVSINVIQISASVSPTSVDGSGNINNQVASSSVTVTPSGGVGPYTYSWSLISGASPAAATSPSSSSTSFYIPAGEGIKGDNTEEFKCVVTDTGSGSTVTVYVYAYITLTGTIE